MTRSTTYGAAALACAIAFAAGGCGGSNTAQLAQARAAAGARADAGMLQFARCMRVHGVQMQDPSHRPGHSGLSIDMPEKGPATLAAYGVCGHFMDATIQLKARAFQALPASVHLGLIRYAECMRTHNVPMLDPDQNGTLNLGNVPGIADGFGRYTPQFHQADASCRHLLPAIVHDDGTGP